MHDHETSLQTDNDRPEQEANKELTSDSSDRSLRRWMVLAIAVIFLAFVIREVLFPFENQPYIEISHGNHTHYVPKDRNETVPVSSFPMRPPGPGERITPDGNIVSDDLKNSPAASND